MYTTDFRLGFKNTCTAKHQFWRLCYFADFHWPVSLKIVLLKSNLHITITETAILLEYIKNKGKLFEKDLSTGSYTIMRISEKLAWKNNNSQNSPD